MIEISAELQGQRRKLVDAYRGAKPRHIRGRLGAARIHAANPRNTEEQRSYWRFVAADFERLLAQAEH